MTTGNSKYPARNLPAQDHEEPPGYSVSKGFVKSNPDNNEAYVQEWADDPWYPAIEWCHKNISAVVPNYNIAQIKEKFGGLRYYIDLPTEEEIDWDKVPTYISASDNRMAELFTWCDRHVARAEAWVDGYEAAQREGDDG